MKPEEGGKSKYDPSFSREQAASAGVALAACSRLNGFNMRATASQSFPRRRLDFAAKGAELDAVGAGFVETG